MEERSELNIDIPDLKLLRDLFGEKDTNRKVFEQFLDIKIIPREGKLKLIGVKQNINLAELTILNLFECLQNGFIITPNDIEHSISILEKDPNISLKNIFLETIIYSHKNRVIFPKSKAQKEYINCIKNYDVIFSIGPAGTGKTYLAMAMAVNYLNQRLVDRIILTRPAVEAGERLGFLPGDIYQKVHPYLRPLYDALHDMVEIEKASKLIEKGIIEIAPLAFMRGRTLNDSFIILDEAQNTTHEQMKMFLTRLGFNSKCIITGDITQIDLPKDQNSGLLEARKVLRSIQDLKFHYFTEIDVVRHRLVKYIIRAYEDQEKKRTRKK